MRAADQQPMLEVAGVAVRRGGELVLDVPEFELHNGETVAIIGPNGAGKTTLLLTVALLLRPSRGTIRILGETVTAANMLRLRRHTSVVFQEPLLLNTSVADNVATGLKLRGVPARQRQAIVAKWLEVFGVAHLSARRPLSLSGGEAQRVSLARAFALDPKLLLLDEPFSALDAPTRATVATDLMAAIRSTRTTTLFVTHDRDEALTFGDRIGVLVRGELRQLASPEMVFGSPADTEVAGFVGMENAIAGVVAGNEEGVACVRVGDLTMEVVSDLTPGTPVMLCLRPEDVTLQLAPSYVKSPPTSARNRLSGQVVGVNPWGGQMRVVVDCGFPLSAAITRRSVSELGITQGTPVIASFKAMSGHLLRRFAIDT